MDKSTKHFLVGALVLGAAAFCVMTYMKKQKAKKAADATAAAALAVQKPDVVAATPGIVAKSAVMADSGVITAQDITG
jgi:hypothetical protein